MKSFEQTKLKDLVDEILPHCLSIKNDSLLLEFSGKLIYEREPDLSEDESQLYEARLVKSFNEIKLKSYSIIYIQAVLEGQNEESNIYIQIHEDAALTDNWQAKYLKKGVRKPIEETK